MFLVQDKNGFDDPASARRPPAKQPGQIGQVKGGQGKSLRAGDNAVPTGQGRREQEPQHYQGVVVNRLAGGEGIDGRHQADGQPDAGHVGADGVAQG